MTRFSIPTLVLLVFVFASLIAALSVEAHHTRHSKSESIEPIKCTQSTKSTKHTKHTKPTKSTKSTKCTKPTKPTKSTKRSKCPKSTKTTKSTKCTKSVELTSKPHKSTKSTRATCTTSIAPPSKTFGATDPITKPTSTATTSTTITIASSTTTSTTTTSTTTTSITTTSITTTSITTTPTGPTTNIFPNIYVSYTLYKLAFYTGASSIVSNFGCHDHKLGILGSVKCTIGPRGRLSFYEGTNCTGAMSYQIYKMDRDSFEGPPIHTMSVFIEA